jgi:hypothetical protein
METKDIATLVLSGLALCVSAVAFWVSYQRGQAEQLRAIRQQLTETTDKITETQLEYSRLMFGEAKDNIAMQQSVDGILGQRTSSLLHQAVYLTTLAPALVTAVDYNTIAYVSANAGDLVVAETNYVKAIQACLNESSRSAATRSYAVFLFSQRRFEEGRKAFRDAATLIKGADNMARMQKGVIYTSWGQCELNNASSRGQAADAFESASSEFMGIDNEVMRQNTLLRLDFAKGSQAPPVPSVLQHGVTAAAIPS